MELGEDPGYVVGDRVRAQREVSRDLVVALAASELLEDLELAVGQRVADGTRGDGARLDGDVQLADAVQQLPGDLRRQHRLSGGRGFDRADDRLDPRALEYVAARAGDDRL